MLHYRVPLSIKSQRRQKVLLNLQSNHLVVCVQRLRLHITEHERWAFCPQGLRSCLILHIHIYSTKEMLKLINFISLCDRKDCNLENVLSVPPALVLFFFFSFSTTTQSFCSWTKPSLLSNNHCILLYLLYYFWGMQYCVLGFWSQNPIWQKVVFFYVFQNKIKIHIANILRYILRKYIFQNKNAFMLH